MNHLRHHQACPEKWPFEATNFTSIHHSFVGGMKLAQGLQTLHCFSTLMAATVRYLKVPIKLYAAHYVRCVTRAPFNVPILFGKVSTAELGNYRWASSDVHKLKAEQFELTFQKHLKISST